MEEDFAALQIPDSNESEKSNVARASSCSELSVRQISNEQRYPRIILNQQSYEQIPDRNVHFRQMKVRTGDDAKWTIISCNLNALAWRNDADLSSSTTNSISLPEDQEHMEVEEESNSTNRLTFVRTSTPSEVDESLALTTMSALSLEKSLRTRKDMKQSSNVVIRRNINKPDKCDKKHYRTEYEIHKVQKSVWPKSPKRPLIKKVCGCIRFTMFFLMSLLLLMFMIAVCHDAFSYRSQHNIDYANAVVALKKEIYGQDRAVQLLTEYLQLDEPSLKVIALVGGTGVGKSYTAQIIKENFPRSDKIDQYFPPIGKIEQVYYSLLFRDLIILENLKEHDLQDVVNFINMFGDVFNERNVTVLAIFNIEQMDDNFTRSIDWDYSLNAIKRAFTDGNINVEIIPYESLSDEALDKCITNAESYSGRTLSKRQFRRVKQYLLTNNAGCKGAISKVQVIDGFVPPRLYI